MGYPMSLPTALILDFGGVLTTDLWESVRGCARREGLPDAALVDLLHHDPRIHGMFVQMERGEVSQNAFEVALAAAAGIHPHRLLARMCADLRPDEAMLAATASLRAQGVRVGVLSNSWGAGPWGDGYFDPYDGYELDERADAVVISDQVGIRKPEPAIFELMLARLDAPATSAVFVDDVASNLPAAQDLGLQVIHHTATPVTLAELERLFAVPVAVVQ
jgi:putative hydrolase of the HAD superfamily